jgi:hypothetical protein
VLLCSSGRKKRYIETESSGIQDKEIILKFRHISKFSTNELQSQLNYQDDKYQYLIKCVV